MQKNRESRPSEAPQMQPLFMMGAVILSSIPRTGGAGRDEGNERTSSEPCAPPPSLQQQPNKAKLQEKTVIVPYINSTNGCY